MKIAVVAANGRVARKVITEAIKRGHDVTAFGRHEENNTDASNYIIKDILDLTKEDLVGYDVVVDAFGTWASETMHLHTDTSQHLADLLENTNTRLLIVGGAGSLYTNKEHTETVSSGPDFPHDWLPVANAMADALTKLRKRNDVHWTYLSPAANFVADGEASVASIHLPMKSLFSTETMSPLFPMLIMPVQCWMPLKMVNHDKERISGLCRLICCP